MKVSTDQEPEADPQDTDEKDLGKEDSKEPEGSGSSINSGNTNGHDHTNGNGYKADRNGFSNGTNGGDNGHHTPNSLNGHTTNGNGHTTNGNGSTTNGNGHLTNGSGANGHGSNGNGHRSVNGSSVYSNGHGTNGSVHTTGTNSHGSNQTQSTKSSTGPSSGSDEQKEPNDTNPVRHTGTVKWFNAHTGWGWITRDDPTESDTVELFVHIDDIEANCEEYEGTQMIGLRDGERVEFNIAPGRKPGQLKAVKVTGPDGTSVIGQAISGPRLRGEKRPYDDPKSPTRPHPS